MRLRANPRLSQVWGLGLRVGYWPCIPAPFVEVHVGPFQMAVWLSLHETSASRPKDPKSEEA